MADTCAVKAKINKRNIVKNLVEVPVKADKSFWIKEMSILNKLSETYGIEFLAHLVPEKKVPSLAFYFAEWVQKKLESQRNQFYYRPEKTPTIELTEKVGEDKVIKTKKTLKEFLS